MSGLFVLNAECSKFRGLGITNGLNDRQAPEMNLMPFWMLISPKSLRNIKAVMAPLESHKSFKIKEVAQVENGSLVA